jgi:hypothetical protein
MIKEEVAKIAEKYRKLADKLYQEQNDEKANTYERFADYLEENNHFDDDDYYETEQDLFEEFNETEAEQDNVWKNWFPEGDDDDSITDFLTKS